MEMKLTSHPRPDFQGLELDGTCTKKVKLDQNYSLFLFQCFINPFSVGAILLRWHLCLVSWRGEEEEESETWPSPTPAWSFPDHWNISGVTHREREETYIKPIFSQFRVSFWSQSHAVRSYEM